MPNGKLVRQAGRRTLVPPPNNLNTTFFEFPSFPRMSIINDYIATRGNHDPVLKYELERRVLAEDEDDADTTRVGNTGIFFNLRAKDDTETAPDTSPNFKTGMDKLGAVPGIDPQTLLDYSIYQVPGLDPEEHDGTVFDVFPGSPAIQDDGTIAFKGNYAIDGLSQTGVFHRKLQDEDGGGDAPLFVVANSLTTIPDGAGECQTDTFGSTSPPSIAEGKIVFLGLDIEEDPKCGGLYEAGVVSSNYADLKSLVTFETAVPGESANFSRFGEGISFDGSDVAFWGGWGNEFETISLCCSVYGEEDRRNYCLIMIRILSVTVRQLLQDVPVAATRTRLSRSVKVFVVG